MNKKSESQLDQCTAMSCPVPSIRTWGVVVLDRYGTVQYSTVQYSCSDTMQIHPIPDRVPIPSLSHPYLPSVCPDDIFCQKRVQTPTILDNHTTWYSASTSVVLVLVLVRTEGRRSIKATTDEESTVLHAVTREDPHSM
jgi:hypothetical protein